MNVREFEDGVNSLRASMDSTEFAAEAEQMFVRAAVCVMQSIDVENPGHGGEGYEVIISKTFGVGSDRSYRIAPGHKERWQRCVAGKCTIRLMVWPREVDRVEHTILPGDDRNSFKIVGGKLVKQ